MDSGGTGGMNMKMILIIPAVQLLGLAIWKPIGDAAKRGDADD